MKLTINEVLDEVLPKLSHKLSQCPPAITDMIKQMIEENREHKYFKPRPLRKDWTK